MDTLSTRLTRSWNLAHPIVSAPMAFAAGGRLAVAVSRSGGLGLIGGGYGDAAWLEEQFEAADRQSVGVGFITWSLHNSPALLTQVLKHAPKAVMLSFGDPKPFAADIHASGAKLICQCQSMAHVRDAVAVGADAVVAQGAEAGGHGASRGAMTLVPEAADYIRASAPDTLLLAAGGIVDGRGLAAALMLGADGVLVGTRFWASREAIVNARHHAAIIDTDGDGTIRTRIADIARQLSWPTGFTARIRRNAFTERWHGHEDELKEKVVIEAPRYQKAFAEGDPDNAAVWFGEAAGLIDSIDTAEVIVERIAAQALACLKRYA